MNVTEAIMRRRSIRVYTEQPVEREKLERILRAGMQAPSAKNQQPWQFLVVQDKKDLEAISNMHEYAHMVAGAGAAIVVLADVGGRDEATNPWVADVAACTQNILLQIVEEGLGGVWLGFYPIPERIKAMREHFSLPDNIMPFSVVSLGYTVRENKVKDRFDENRIHWGKY